MLKPVLLLVSLACLGLHQGNCVAADDGTKSAQQALSRGLQYLARQQSDDGGWHSEHYGQLKAGPGVTALVLYSFSRCPSDLRNVHPDLAKNGYAFFDPGLRKKKTLAASDGTLDYPTYASALWLSGHSRLNQDTPNAGDTRKKLTDYLLEAQLLESRGFQRNDPSYGGWDFLGAEDAHGITTGTNISLAAFILEALVEEKSNDPRIVAARRHAGEWLLRTQQPDGGFAFTPEPASLNNKAKFMDDDAGNRPRSYGTATCDGVRALVALGVDSDDPRLRRAVQWLVDRPSVDLVPGFETLPPEAGWQRGLRYYYYASLATASRHFPPADRDARRRLLIATLLKQQDKEGKWVNESPAMREDDPLIATSFAVTALGVLLEK